MGVRGFKGTATGAEATPTRGGASNEDTGGARGQESYVGSECPVANACSMRQDHPRPFPKHENS